MYEYEYVEFNSKINVHPCLQCFRVILQERCFGTPLEARSLEELKRLIKQSVSNGLMPLGQLSGSSSLSAQESTSTGSGGHRTSGAGISSVTKGHASSSGGGEKEQASARRWASRCAASSRCTRSSSSARATRPLGLSFASSATTPRSTSAPTTSPSKGVSLSCAGSSQSVSFATLIGH